MCTHAWRRASPSRKPHRHDLPPCAAHDIRWCTSRRTAHPASHAAPAHERCDVVLPCWATLWRHPNAHVPTYSTHLPGRAARSPGGALAPFALPRSPLQVARSTLSPRPADDRGAPLLGNWDMSPMLCPDSSRPDGMGRLRVTPFQSDGRSRLQSRANNRHTQPSWQPQGHPRPNHALLTNPQHSVTARHGVVSNSGTPHRHPAAVTAGAGRSSTPGVGCLRRAEPRHMRPRGSAETSPNTTRPTPAPAHAPLRPNTTPTTTTYHPSRAARGCQRAILHCQCAYENATAPAQPLLFRLGYVPTCTALHSGRAQQHSAPLHDTHPKPLPPTPCRVSARDIRHASTIPRALYATRNVRYFFSYSARRQQCQTAAFTKYRCCATRHTQPSAHSLRDPMPDRRAGDPTAACSLAPASHSMPRNRPPPTAIAARSGIR